MSNLGNILRRKVSYINKSYKWSVVTLIIITFCLVSGFLAWIFTDFYGFQSLSSFKQRYQAQKMFDLLQQHDQFDIQTVEETIPISVKESFENIYYTTEGTGMEIIKESCSCDGK